MAACIHRCSRGGDGRPGDSWVCFLLLSLTAPCRLTSLAQRPPLLLFHNSLRAAAPTLGPQVTIGVRGSWP